MSYLESTLWVHDKVSSDVVEHDRVLLVPLLKFTPNYPERLHVYHSISRTDKNLISSFVGPLVSLYWTFGDDPTILSLLRK